MVSAAVAHHATVTQAVVDQRIGLTDARHGQAGRQVFDAGNRHVRHFGLNNGGREAAVEDCLIGQYNSTHLSVSSCARSAATLLTLAGTHGQ